MPFPDVAAAGAIPPTLDAAEEIAAEIAEDIGGDDAGRPPETLASACRAMEDAAVLLALSVSRRERVRKVFGPLPVDVLDARTTVSQADYREFLEGRGARQFHQLARLLRRDAIPLALRREHLLEVADALEFCLTGLVDRLEQALSALQGADGGLLAAFTRAYGDLRREILEDVVRRTIGRDPALGTALTDYFPHYLSAMEQRLSLPHARTRPRDLHFETRDLRDDQVEAGRRALAQALTPLRPVRRLAEEALVLLRGRLRASGVDPQSIDIEDQTQFQALRGALAHLARTVGAVPREHVIEVAPAVDADEAAPDRYRVVEEAGLLTLGAWRALAAAGARAGASDLASLRPVLVVAWRQAGRGSEVLSLADELLWVREDGVRERRLRVEDLALLPLRAGCSSPGADPRVRALSVSARAAALRAVLGDATEAQLARLDPDWWVEADLARDCCRRLSPTTRAAWWCAVASGAISTQTRAALITVADETGAWETLSDLTAVPPAVAVDLWRRCDGAGALAQALRAGEGARIACWSTLLMKGLPKMSRATLLPDLAGKDERGRTVLLDAMRQGSESSLRAWLDLVAGLPAGALTPMATVLLLAGHCGATRPALAEALKQGRATMLTIYLEHLWSRVDARTLLPSQLRTLLFASLGGGADHDVRPTLLVAMEDDLAEVVGVWLDAAVRAARRGVLDRADLAELLNARGSGDRGAYAVAMSVGAHRTRRRFLDTVERSGRTGLLGRHHVITLLLGGSGGMHAPSVAARHGFAQAVEEHVRSEVRLLRDRPGPSFSSLWRTRWWALGAHTAIDAAMESGDVRIVRCLVAAALDPVLGLPSPLLVRAFERRRPQDRLALRTGVESGHADAVGAWVAGVAEAAEQRRLGRSQVRRLLRAELGPGESALHLAAIRAHPQTMAAGLAREFVTVAGRAGLRSRDLLSLLGHRRGDGAGSPLALALRHGHAVAVGGLMDQMLLAWSLGRLQPRHLGWLLSMRRRDGTAGLAGPGPAEELADVAPAAIEAAVGAYVEGLLKALRLGAIRVESVIAWSSTGRSDTDQAMRPLILRAVLAQERQGSMAADQLAALRAAFPALPVLTAAP